MDIHVPSTVVFEVADNVSTDSIDLSYSTDNGVTLDPIVTNFVIGSNGINWGYDWAISPTVSLTTTAKVRMLARDTSGDQSTLDAN